LNTDSYPYNYALSHGEHPLEWTGKFGRQTPELVAIVNHELGMIARTPKVYDASVAHLLKALEQGAQCPQWNATQTMMELGSVYLAKEDLSAARQYYQLAEETLDPLDHIQCAHLHYKLGLLYRNVHPDSAEEHLLRANKLFPEGSAERARVQRELAYVALGQRRPSAALGLLKDLQGNPFLDRGVLLLDLAWAELALEHLDDALRALSQSQTFFRQTGNNLELAHSMLLEGMIAIRRGRLHDAREVFAEALSMPVPLERKLQLSLEYALRDVISRLQPGQRLEQS